MEDRDFKGIWIPKEIWLNKNLTALDKVIYAEIDSLDNENGCYASNKYLAEFCGCSERKVSDTISKLKSLGLITVAEVEFDGRHRIIYIEKSAMQGRKICDAGSQNLQHSNIDNRIEDSNTISINTNSSSLHNFDFGKTKQEKPKKDNLYSKCLALINEFTDDAILQSYLTEFLKRCLVNSKEGGVPFYTNTFRGKLNKLKTLSDDNYVQRNIVMQTINNGWNGFYELKQDRVYNKDVSSEFGVVKSVTYTEEEKLQQEAWRKEMERNGKQVKF